jgi:hypothetical protein
MTPKVFGTGMAGMSVIGAPIACSAVTAGSLVTSRKAMRFMDAPVTIWGELRGDSRLITNLSKKAWTRKSVIPRSLKSFQGHHDVNAKEMLAGYEDVPAPPERI